MPSRMSSAAASAFFGRKIVRLPSEGVLLACTDLQGNLADYQRMKALYLEEEARGTHPTVLFCGDLVHGPSDALIERGWPDALGEPYRDESPALLRDLMDFSQHARVCSLLGNHEHAHIGGPLVAKFHEDEAAALNRRLRRDRARVHAFFRQLPLIAVAPCGAVFCHAAPAGHASDWASYEAVDYAGYAHHSIEEMLAAAPLGPLLWARFARESQALALHQSVLPKREWRGFVAFGHDIAHAGFKRVGDRQLCLSTSFGVKRERKRYLRIDLSGDYESVHALREGHELLPLYP